MPIQEKEACAARSLGLCQGIKVIHNPADGKLPVHPTIGGCSKAVELGQTRDAYKGSHSQCTQWIIGIPLLQEVLAFPDDC